MIFSKRFKELRIEMELTQDKLVEQFNKRFNMTIAKSSISQYENDRAIPEIETLIKFTSFYKTSIDYLLGISEIRNVAAIDEYIVNNYISIEGLSPKDKDMVQAIIDTYKEQQNKATA